VSYSPSLFFDLYLRIIAPLKAASIIFQLRVGHTLLNQYLHCFKKIDKLHCPACRHLKETAEHFILNCPKYTHERWPMLRLSGSRTPKFTKILASHKLIAPLTNYIRTRITTHTTPLKTCNPQHSPLSSPPSPSHGKPPLCPPDNDPPTTPGHYLLNAHDVGLMAEGDAFAEENSHIRQEVVEGVVEAYVLHRVLYPQVHENGFKKKKHGQASLICLVPGTTLHMVTSHPNSGSYAPLESYFSSSSCDILAVPRRISVRKEW
jgi:hypothetical protein